MHKRVLTSQSSQKADRFAELFENVVLEYRRRYSPVCLDALLLLPSSELHTILASMEASTRLPTGGWRFWVSGSQLLVLAGSWRLFFKGKASSWQFGQEACASSN